MGGTVLAATDATVDAVVAALDTDGYCIVTGVLGADEVAAAKASIEAAVAAVPVGRNDFEGFRTQRVYALFAKTREFDGPAIHPLVLGVLDRVLGHCQQSAPTGIVIGPGEKEQFLHTDQSIYPLPADYPPVVLNTMWPLDDFTLENGATRFVPGSHRWGRDGPARQPTDADPIVHAVMPAGSVAFYVGTIWHGGGANRTGTTRTGVILEYVAAWLRAQETHLLAVPRETVAALPERLQELLGYNIYPPFVGYVDGRHPRRYILEPVHPPNSRP
jgi:ectoine hydroxylase-related dioxygenase (phytanoyl-CoA dioxygenase family)